MLKKIVIVSYFISIAIIFFYPPWLAGTKDSMVLFPVNTLINIFQRPLWTRPEVITGTAPLHSIDMNLLFCRIGFTTALFGGLYFSVRK